MQPINWRIAKSLLTLREQINNLAPHRSRLNDGTIGDEHHASTNSDHNPHVKDERYGVVTALDITNDIAGGCDVKKIVDAIVLSKDTRIKYLIWNKKIISSLINPWVWRPYTGKNPHNKHFHLSVKTDKLFYDDDKKWQIT